MMKQQELQKILSKALKESINHFLTYEVIDWPSSYPNKTKVVSEGLLMTYSVGKTEKIITRCFDLPSLGCELISNYKSNFEDFRQSVNSDLSPIREMNKNWAFNLFFKEGFQYCPYNTLMSIIKLTNTCGWHFSNFENCESTFKRNIIRSLYQEYMDKPCFLIFRAKYGIIKDNKTLGDNIYHICPTRKVNKIMTQGLIPKNNDRTTNHPQRVYLFVNRNILDKWTNIAQNFYELSGIREFTLLEINTKELKEYMTFHFDDVRMIDLDAVYIDEVIPPQYITIIDNCIVDVDKDGTKPQEFIQSVNN